MSATADQVVRVAASQIGYYDPPGGGRSKFESWYGLSGPWCAMFQSWCAAQVGALDIIPKHAYTPSGADWFRARGRWHNGIAGARRGDLVYFNFPDNLNRIQHVGIVESVNSDGSVNTIEGNTSSVSQTNGGHVARKRRKAYIVGYGRPAYVAAPPKPGKPDCTALQRAVRTTADNSWGPATDQHCDALREASLWGGNDFPWGVAFTQGVVGVAQDGHWGPKSVAGHDRTTIAVQDALRGMGFNPGTSDGRWGPASERAYQGARAACHI